MHVQRTWEAIMHTPLTLGDIVLGEIVWAASKSVLSGVAIMIVAGALGYASFPSTLIALPVIVLTGLAFASTAMIVTALAPSYDFFMFYQTLARTPMLLLSGVFFPVTQLPALAQHVTQVLPLYHAVELIRPAMLGRPLDAPSLMRAFKRGEADETRVVSAAAEYLGTAIAAAAAIAAPNHVVLGGGVMRDNTRFLEQIASCCRTHLFPPFRREGMRFHLSRLREDVVCQGAARFALQKLGVLEVRADI